LFGLLHQRGDCHAKAKLRTIGLQIGGGAGASFAEAEVGAYDHVVQAKAAVQGFIRKFKRSEGSECRVERQLIQFFHAEFGKTRGARGTAHQPEGRGGRGEVGAWMRLEGDDAQRRVGGGVARQLDHGSVAEVHAVKISDRSRGAAIVLFYKLVVRNNPHGFD